MFAKLGNGLAELGNGVDGVVNSITVWYTAPNGLGNPAV